MLSESGRSFKYFVYNAQCFSDLQAYLLPSGRYGWGHLMIFDCCVREATDNLLETVADDKNSQFVTKPNRIDFSET